MKIKNNVSDFINYFRTLSVEHYLVQHNINAEHNTEIVNQCKFKILEIDEVITGLQKNIGNDICVYLSPYEGKGSDNNGNSFNGKYSGGFIIARRTTKNDITDIQKSYEDCEIVMWNFINRIINDSIDSDGNRCGTPFRKVSLNDFKFTFVGPIWECHYGWFVEFDWMQNRNNEMDIEKTLDTSIWIKNNSYFKPNNLFIGNSNLKSAQDFVLLLNSNKFFNYSQTADNIQSVLAAGEYHITQNTYNNSLIISYNDTSGLIQVYNGISQNNFSNCNDLEFINIAGAKKIGNYCFNNLPKLQTLKLPDLQMINNGMKNLAILQKLQLPLVERIGVNSITNMPKLEQLYLPICNEVLTNSIKNLDAIMYLEFLNITKIGSNSFTDLPNVITIKLPKLISINDTAIEENTFSNCPNLQSITISTALAQSNNANINRLIAQGVTINTI